jgi:hypothetical protein
MHARTLRPVLAALLFAAGCVTGPTLQPLPSTPTLKEGVAVAETNGVRLLADGNTWHGNPSDLESVVTPVLVHLDNQSGHALRIDYKDFVLVGGSRFHYAALSPFDLPKEGLTAVGGSGGHVGMSFGVGMGYGGPWGWGPGYPYHGYGWGAPWGWGPGYYGVGWYDPFWGPYSYIPPEPLPTRDMVRKSLPEGTLDNGGSLTGFIYFQNVGNREGQVTLQEQLVDAHTGEQLGTLSIPFGVRP